MSFHRTVNRDQLSILRAAVDDYCTVHGIEDEKYRRDVGELVSSILDKGSFNFEDLLRKLNGISLKRKLQA